MTYQFDTEHAEKYGLEESVMLGNLVFWIAKNRANETHFHNGRTWTYNSADAFARLFPFWSTSQIRRVLKSLEKQKIIRRGNFNTKAMDRTLWFALENEEELLESSDLTKTTNAFDENAKCISRKRQMHVTKSSNDYLPTDIKHSDSKPDSKHADEEPPSPPSSPDGSGEMALKLDSETPSSNPTANAHSMSGFERFWGAYPKRKNKGDAEKAWRTAGAATLLEAILPAVEAAKQSREWQKDQGQFIPYPATWLRSKGWEDEVSAIGQSIHRKKSAKYGW